MKRSAVFVVALTIAAGAATASAQEMAAGGKGVFSSRSSHQRADMAKVERSYLSCLKSENDGVVESAIAQVTHLKLYCPDKCFAKLEGTLSKLSVEGRTAAIRYKASLAMMVFNAPGMFSKEQQGEYQTEGDLFAAIGQRLQHSIIG